MLDGKVVHQCAYAKISQEGYAIKGVTNLGDRCWTLDGTISPNGYIYGIYSAEHYADDGIGNFILHIQSADRLEGIWSGYDSINKYIASGGGTHS